jgi:hypothetical protein
VIIIKQTESIDQIYSGILVYSGFQRNLYFEDTTITKTVKVGNSASNSCGSSIKWKRIVNKRNKSCNAYIYTLIYSIVFSFLKWLIENSPEEGNQRAFEDYRCCF